MPTTTITIITEQPPGYSDHNHAASHGHPHHNHPSTYPITDGSVDNSPPKTDPPPPSRTRKSLIIPLLALATLTPILDITLLAPALVTITIAHGLWDHQHVWVIASALFTAALAVPVFVGLARVFSMRVLMILASAMLIAGAAVAAKTDAFGALIAGRALMGVGMGGYMMLPGLALGSAFEGTSRVRVSRGVFASWCLALGLGPVTGGTMAQRGNWRWCFWIHVILGGMCLILAIFLPKSSRPRPSFGKRVKGTLTWYWMSGLAATASFVLLLYGLQIGVYKLSEQPWDNPNVVYPILIGIFLFLFFLLHEWRLATHPIIPFGIFKQPANAAALVLCICHSMIFIAVLYFLPLYMQTIAGRSPFQTGAWLLMTTMFCALWALVTTEVVRHAKRLYIPLWLSTVGLIPGIAAFMKVSDKYSAARLAMLQFGVALPLGALFVLIGAVLQRNLAVEDLPAGIAALAFVRLLSAGVGLVAGQLILSSLLRKSFQAFFWRLLSPHLADELANGQAVTRAGFLLNKPQGWPILGSAAGMAWRGRHVFANTLRRLWIFYIVLAAVGMLASLLMIKKKPTAETKVETSAEEEERLESQTEVVGASGGIISAQSEVMGQSETVLVNDTTTGGGRVSGESGTRLHVEEAIGGSGARFSGESTQRLRNETEADSESVRRVRV